MRHDAKTYRAVCPVLDKLFKDHGDKAMTAITRYLRIRRETRKAESRIEDLEAELEGLKKVESLARKKKLARCGRSRNGASENTKERITYS